jgi:hypothetical protein
MPIKSDGFVINAGPTRMKFLTRVRLIWASGILEVIRVLASMAAVLIINSVFHEKVLERTGTSPVPL